MVEPLDDKRFTSPLRRCHIWWSNALSFFILLGISKLLGFSHLSASPKPTVQGMLLGGLHNQSRPLDIEHDPVAGVPDGLEK